jgi:hypothetical protein
MILDSKSITALGAVLTKPPFSGSPELARAIWRVLEAGNLKHGDDRQSAITHAEHAVVHLKASDDDTETGLPHRAHAAARLLLALLEIVKGELPESLKMVSEGPGHPRTFPRILSAPDKPHTVKSQEPCAQQTRFLKEE